jgi:hypothetical protein
MSPAALPALHAALIAAHAVAGLIALCLGAIVLRPQTTTSHAPYRATWRHSG